MTKRRDVLPFATAVIAVAVGVGVVSGCTGSGASPSSSTNAAAVSSAVSQASPASSTASVPPVSAGPSAGSSPTGAPTTAQSVLQQVLLGAPDFPTGWTESPAGGQSTDSAGQASLARCVGGRNTSAAKTASASSPRFTQTTSVISSSVSRYRAQTDVDADTALLKSPKISACYRALSLQSLRTSLPKGSKIGAVDITVSPVPAGGPKNVAAVAFGKVTVTTSGQTVTFYQTTAFITGRFVEAQVDFEAVATAIPTALQEQLIDLVAGRVAQL